MFPIKTKFTNFVKNESNYLLRIFLGFLFVALVSVYFSNRYRISLPSSKNSCLNASFYIIDTWDKHYNKGDLIAFGFPKENDVWYPVDTPFIKIVGASAGDKVNVSENEYLVNGKSVSLSMSYIMGVLELKNEDVGSEFIVPSGFYFGVGETLKSYDSRFWGLIPQGKTLGKAYAIL